MHADFVLFMKKHTHCVMQCFFVFFSETKSCIFAIVGNTG